MVIEPESVAVRCLLLIRRKAGAFCLLGWTDEFKVVLTPRECKKEKQVRSTHSLDHAETTRRKRRSPHPSSSPKSENTRDAKEQLKLPTVISTVSKLHPKQVRKFSGAHQDSCNIHSLSVSLDGETLLSSDDLRLKFWNIQHPEKPLTVLDFSRPIFKIEDVSGMPATVLR